ncbi:TniQ family protein [Ornithinimicrobium faecis]|uniref:TniQ family protein n=1 Tax=Ornithinimicrobium faecis TaxID=2934158 RepID=UPI002118E1D4|nr:TniQ family protein [Ornithinimicrobium sp. HY1745]
MRPDQALPVRPTALDGEALSGYAVRLADANGITPNVLIGQDYTDVTASPAMVRRLSTAAGMTPAQVIGMTMAPMPPSIRGRGKLARHGWRLHQSMTWICPVCTDQRGYRALLWRLALMPVCTRCRVLLVRAHDIHRARTAPDALLDLTGRLIGLVQDATTGNRTARARLASYRKVCAAVAHTINHDWPPRPAGLPRADLPAARMWGPHPCPDPATTATILTAAEPALGSKRARERFTQEVMDRYEQRAQSPAAPVVLPSTLRPEERPPVLPVYRYTDRARLTQLTHDLRQVVVATGLHARHVPGFLLLPGDDPVPPGPLWRERGLATIGLHMLISRAHGEPGAATAACHDLGTTDTETNFFLDGIRLHRGIPADQDELLLAGVEHLLDGGLVDYRRRRQALRAVRRLPTLPLPADRLPDISDVPGHRLALGWMWVHFARGPMWTSSFPSIRTSTVMAFDAAIDPEARLHLHEAAHAITEGPELHANPTGHGITVPTTARWTG